MYHLDREQTTSAPSTPFYIVAAHGGAGYHPPSSDSSIRRSLRTALSSTLATFFPQAPGAGAINSTTTSSTLNTATRLIAALEDDPNFNAGYGSNLTFDGDVECDAALMDNSNSDASSSFGFGSVGAVSGVRNPVMLARRVLDARRRQRGTSMSMGRVPPLMMVGEGAAKFAREVGVCVVRETGEMVAPRAREEWRVWKARWEQEEREVLQRHVAAAAEAASIEVAEPGASVGVDSLHARQDTVGAVVLLDDAGDIQISAGVSRCELAHVVVAIAVHPVRLLAPCRPFFFSGGLLLKPSGRVGEVRLFLRIFCRLFHLLVFGLFFFWPCAKTELKLIKKLFGSTIGSRFWCWLLGRTIG
jgi:taspase, threonine aspartase, 1